jgi:hypothetical protein
MKQKLLMPIIVLLILSLSITGCSSSSNDANQGNEASNPDSSEEMIFPEDEIDPDEASEEMVFEDAEGILITKNNTPPDGIWLWTNSDPIYEGCPVEMSNVAPPPDPPLEVKIESFENGEILLISTDAGAVELLRSSFSETASIYEALVLIPITDGKDLTVDYYLDFNVFDDGGIEGTLTSIIPEFDDCQALRGFSATYMKP